MSRLLLTTKEQLVSTTRAIQPVVSTVAMAIHEVSEALNCNLVMTKVGRCSSKETVIADCLSKADFKKFYELMPERKPSPARIPAALLRWINNPVEDTKLGHKILKEMAQYTMVLGYNC